MIDKHIEIKYGQFCIWDTHQINSRQKENIMTELTTEKKITIANTQFVITPKFAEGHVLTANEAAALNQTFYENVNNNMRKTVKEALDPNSKEPLTIEQLQEKITEYANSYEFGAGRTTSNSMVKDPVDKAAIKIAEKIIKKFLKDQKKSEDDLSDEQWNNIVASVAAKPEVRAQAEADVAAAKAAREATEALAATSVDIEI